MSSSNPLNSAIQACEKIGLKSLAKPLLPLTFGIEFEFVLQLHPTEIPGITTHNTSIANTATRQHIISLITPQISNGAEPKNVPVAKEADAIDFTTWNVTGDTTIKMQESAKGKCYGVELISPVLSFGEEEYGEVRRVCEAVTGKCNTDVHQSCALHIHIGNVTNDIFDFPLIRKLVAILWTFEPHIESLHPKSRLFAQDTVLFGEPRHRSTSLRRSPKGNRLGMEKFV
jgi:hypothetical protein